MSARRVLHLVRPGEQVPEAARAGADADVEIVELGASDAEEAERLLERIFAADVTVVW